uniref:Uncharacterized protein n=1 Tax=Arundo donax TaxID=35708 RepID=A0A0A9E9G0_ARUDO
MCCSNNSICNDAVGTCSAVRRLYSLDNSCCLLCARC